MTRLLNLHDVFHVVTGYDRDLRGEVAVLAFTLAQTRSPGIAYVLLRVLLRAGWSSEMGKLIRQGFRRGLRSAWFDRSGLGDAAGRARSTKFATSSASESRPSTSRCGRPGRLRSRRAEAGRENARYDA